MPTSMYHLKIANKFANKVKKYDNADFYLGAIAPDSVNLEGFAEKSIRWDAHKRARDLREWKSNIENFYTESHKADIADGRYSESYLAGYVIHVLTDIAADEIFYEKGLREQIMKDKNMTEEESFKFFKSQIGVYEKSNIEEDWWKHVVELLKNSKASEINDINADKIDAWRDKVLAEYAEYSKVDVEYLNDEITEKIYEIVEHDFSFVM